MQLNTLDWTIVFVYFLFVLAIGLLVSKKSSTSINDYFLSGRNMPWWLLGISMVATTFSADTPNLVTGLVRENGVSANWAWWAFLLTGMLTVFVYARLWRRSMVMTDVEFYELRYSGHAAGFLRGFRALYLGLVFNVLVIATVSLAAIKFGEIILGWSAWQTLLIAGSVTIVYSAVGGLRAVLLTDFVQFFLAMIGSVWSCIYLIRSDHIGGLSMLLSHENVQGKLNLFPNMSDPAVWVPLLVVPLAVQWWASYYPGAEPGGGGYVAQRMFSAKNESHAIGSTLLFNIAHYALRPWPWILVALASLIVFPTIADIQAVFPNLSEDKLGHDIAYPAMLTLLPSGLLGLVAASLIAAFMSTISTQLNLGASYLVNDFYHRFIDHNASQIKLINAGRIFTLLSALLGLGLSLFLKDATEAFNLLLLLGAGTGLIYILRWFWWRINAYTEIIAMISSLFIGIYFTFFNDSLLGWQEIVTGTVITTLIWLSSVFFTPSTSQEKLSSFYQKIYPQGPGWNRVREAMTDQGISLPERQVIFPTQILSFLIGSLSVYFALFATGYWIYGENRLAVIMTVGAVLGFYFLRLCWKKMIVPHGG